MSRRKIVCPFCKEKLRNCPLSYPENLDPLMCGYSNEKECGFHIETIKTIKGRKEVIGICTYRAKEVGMKSCIKERLRFERFYDL